MRFVDSFRLNDIFRQLESDQAALGSVLEVGFGSGLNLPFYDKAKVLHVWALDPSRELWALAGERVRGAGFPVEFLHAAAEEIPLPDRSADTVLVTFTLCTLPDVSRALREMARVLKPGGGCNLNRPIPSLLEQGGHIRNFSSWWPRRYVTITS